MQIKMVRKGLALLLALVFCLTLLPTAAFAEETEGGSEAEPAEEQLLTEGGREEASAPEDGEQAEEPAEPAHEHEYTAAVTEPTCTEQGYTTYTCACGDSYTDEYTDASGHSPETVEEIPAAAGQEGISAGVVCAVCGEVLEGCEKIPALTEEAFEPGEVESIGEESAEEEPAGEEPSVEEAEAQKPAAEEPAEPVHEHEYTAVVTEPTCTEQGYTTYTCACGDSYVDDYTEPLNHPEVIDIPEVPATETMPGTAAGKKCALCGALLEGCEEIPMLEKTVITIVKQPKNTKASDGEAVFTVTATVNKGLELAYQWQRLDAGILYADEASREAAWKNMEDEMSDTLKLTGLAEEETLSEAVKYLYRCILSVGEVTEKTAEVKLLVPLTTKGRGEASQEAKDAKQLGAPVLTEAFNSATGVRVSWQAVGDAVKYRLLRKNLTKGETNWLTVGETTELNLIDKTAVSAQRYTYTVRAIDPIGNPGKCDEIGRTCTYIAKADITNLTVVSNAEGVAVAWTKPAGAKKFRVMRKTDGGTWSVIAVVEGTSYIDQTAPKGCKLWYTVRGVSMDNTVLINSYNGTGWSIYHVDPPVMTEAFNSATGVRVSWKGVTGAAKYRLLRKNLTKNETTWTTIGETKDLTLIDKSAVSGQRYTYTVQCVDANDRTSSTINAAGRTCTYIARSDITGLKAADDGIRIIWSKPAGAKNFRIFRKTDGSSTWTAIEDIRGTSFTDTSATTGTKYWYTVRAITLAGDMYTNSYNATGWSLNYLDPPIMTETMNNVPGIRVSWNAVAGAAKYRVLRKNATNGDANWTVMIETKERSWTDWAVADQNRYSYTVECVDSNGRTASAKASTIVPYFESATTPGIYTKETGRTCAYYDLSFSYGYGEARSMLGEINALRTGQDAWYWNEDNRTKTVCSDLEPLVYDYQLEQVAMQRAIELVKSYSHTRPDGTTCWRAYSDFGYTPYPAGENIAYGFGTASAVFNAWSERDKDYSGQGHRRNMLNDRAKRIGIGHIIYNGMHFWVQEFSQDVNRSNFGT